MTAIHCTNVAPTQKPRMLSPLTWLADAIAVRRQRNKLVRLDDAALRDIGLSYRDARREARKPIWDVPSYWS
ncbi:DUF1127 domain-containing protein [Aliiroseovarius subalbicans]|uniref:DUF1127 domain-containing protein n=1 Tax=Aliiroseovarius subalbicans TaxID=2925840 RepID=UPI001F570243|nr:DUF1127 domain-containing protein [Aliiroseovarius subalbicans]MCI2400518.1 DUF1127 domain-containing protein [Aliiroseovarius subalbicans]